MDEKSGQASVLTFWILELEELSNVHRLSTVTGDDDREIGAGGTAIVSFGTIDWRLDLYTDIERFWEISPPPKLPARDSTEAILTSSDKVNLILSFCQLHDPNLRPPTEKGEETYRWVNASQVRTSSSSSECLGSSRSSQYGNGQNGQSDHFTFLLY